MKAKTREKLAKSRTKASGTFQDPIRLYDRPIYFDIWFLVGIMLTLPDILTGVLIFFKADFSWELANRSISGYLFLLGQTIVMFTLGSVVPVFIRRSIRRGKLSVLPIKTVPGFYADPIRKNSQRFWNGDAWTDELRAPYKREVGRTLFLCGVFFAISLLLGLGSAVKGLNAEKVKQPYEASTSLALQLTNTGPALATPDSAVSTASAFASTSSDLNAALANFPRKEGTQTQVDGTDLAKYESYAVAYASLADRMQVLADHILACESVDSACAHAAVKSSSASILAAAAALPAVLNSDQTKVQ